MYDSRYKDLITVGVDFACIAKMPKHGDIMGKPKTIPRLDWVRG